MHSLIGVLINRGKHSLLSCHKSKHSTLKVITGRYIITLNNVFGHTIKVGYSSYLLYYELLVMCSWAGTNSGMDYWNGTLYRLIIHSNSYEVSKLGRNDFLALANA